MRLLAPSILSADLLQLEKQIKIVEENGADLIHVDVMDGHFVPNMTFGPTIIKTLKKITNLPLDVHLMVTNPKDMVKEFAEAGADTITIHQEACVHLDRILSMIKEYGCKAGISLNPATPVETLTLLFDRVDLILIMSVNPGFGGQKFINYSLDKIKALDILKKQNGYSYLIEVDGGVNLKNAPLLLNAGVNILVSGNSIFNQKDIAKSCREFKSIINKMNKVI
ncbi:MAG: ribulose-phosphate 3-epimerase [Calditrichaceae bacterium]|nr:ribulose-phosphate 3-epimerase [Calditrichaceae bacterium]